MCGHPGLEAAPFGPSQERVPAMPVPASGQSSREPFPAVLELPADCAMGGHVLFPVPVEARLHGNGSGREVAVAMCCKGTQGNGAGSMAGVRPAAPIFPAEALRAWVERTDSLRERPPSEMQAGSLYR